MFGAHVENSCLYAHHHAVAIEMDVGGLSRGVADCMRVTFALDCKWWYFCTDSPHSMDNLSALNDILAKSTMTAASAAAASVFVDAELVQRGVLLHPEYMKTLDNMACIRITPGMGVSSDLGHCGYGSNAFGIAYNAATRDSLQQSVCFEYRLGERIRANILAERQRIPKRVVSYPVPRSMCIASLVAREACENISQAFREVLRPAMESVLLCNRLTMEGQRTCYFPEKSLFETPYVVTCAVCTTSLPISALRMFEKTVCGKCFDLGLVQQHSKGSHVEVPAYEVYHPLCRFHDGEFAEAGPDSL